MRIHIVFLTGNVFIITEVYRFLSQGKNFVALFQLADRCEGDSAVLLHPT